MSVAIGMAQPACAVGVAHGDQHEDQRRHDHAAEGGDHGQDGLSRLPEGPDDQLALELEPGDEEEDGQQPVGRPRLEAEVEVQGRGAHDEVFEVLVRVGQTGVRRDQTGHGRGEQQRATHRLLPQRVGDEPVLTEGQPREEDATRRGVGDRRLGVDTGTSMAGGPRSAGCRPGRRPVFPARRGQSIGRRESASGLSTFQDASVVDAGEGVSG